MPFLKKPSTESVWIQILCLNCYLIPGWLVTKANETCKYQGKRAKDIGHFSTDKDIVILQEMWGSQVYQIQHQIEATHNIHPINKTFSFFGWCSTIISTIIYYLRKTGGLWFAAKKSFKILHSSRQTYVVSGTNSKKGIQSILLDMNSVWPGKYLLIFNTHLDPAFLPHATNNQRSQIQQLRKFMLETVNLVEKSVEMKNCGVLLAGDFNFEQNSEIYSEFLEIFGGKLNDLYQEIHKGKDDPTYDSENSLTMWNSERIDFLFSVSSLGIVEFGKLKCRNMEIVKQRKGEEFSDHWAQVAHVTME